MITTFNIRGFIGSVEKPRHLKITGTDERATIDLFVMGGLEKRILFDTFLRNVLSRIISMGRYILMQWIQALSLTHLRAVEKASLKTTQISLPCWTILRGMHYRIYLTGGMNCVWGVVRRGTTENPRKTRKQRKARDLYNAAREEYEPSNESETRDEVDGWLNEMRTDAEFNISSYVDCFLSENLLRQYIRSYKLTLDKAAPAEILQWKNQENQRLGEANNKFWIH